MVNYGSLWSELAEEAVSVKAPSLCLQRARRQRS